MCYYSSFRFHRRVLRVLLYGILLLCKKESSNQNNHRWCFFSWTKKTKKKIEVCSFRPIGVKWHEGRRILTLLLCKRSVFSYFFDFCCTGTGLFYKEKSGDAKWIEFWDRDCLPFIIFETKREPQRLTSQKRRKYSSIPINWSDYWRNGIVEERRLSIYCLFLCWLLILTTHTIVGLYIALNLSFIV